MLPARPQCEIETNKGDIESPLSSRHHHCAYHTPPRTLTFRAADQDWTLLKMLIFELYLVNWDTGFCLGFGNIIKHHRQDHKIINGSAKRLPEEEEAR